VSSSLRAGNELKIARWIEGVVAEAQSSSDHAGGTIANEDQGQALYLSGLEKSVLLIWIQIFESSSGIWPFFGTIGTALRIYSEPVA